MLKFLNYFWVYSFKRASSIIFPIAFLIVFDLLLLLRILSNSEPVSQIINLPFYYYLFTYVIGPLFIASKTICLFKQSQEDGSELLLISKPSTRKIIISSKFLVLATHIIWFSIFIFLATLAISFVDPNSSLDQILKLSGSLGIGVFLINFSMVGIFIIFSLFLGIIPTMLFTNLFTIFTATISAMFSTLGQAMITHPRKQFVAINLNQFSKDKIKPIERSTLSSRFIAKQVEEQESKKYKFIVYGDIFWQGIKLLNILVDKKTYLPSDRVHMKKVIFQNTNTKEFKSDYSVSFFKNDKDKKYIYINTFFLDHNNDYKKIKQNSDNYPSQFLHDSLTLVKLAQKIILTNLGNKLIRQWLMAKDYQTKFAFFNPKTPIGNIFNQKLKTLIKVNQFQKYQKLISNSDPHLLIFMLWNRIELQKIDDFPDSEQTNLQVKVNKIETDKLFQRLNPNQKKFLIKKNGNEFLGLGIIPQQFEVDEKLVIFQGKPWINTKDTIFVWILLAIGFLFIGTNAYFNKDFR